MKSFLLRSSILNLSLLLLFACGSGGGSTGGGSTTSAPTSAIVRVNLDGSLVAGKAIAGAGFTVTLPANVTPALTGGAVASGVVTLSGTFASSSIAPIVNYTPASGAVPGSMQVILSDSSANGITSVGEVATITLQLANGVTPVTANFTADTASVTVIDTLGTSLPGMTVSVASVKMQ